MSIVRLVIVGKNFGSPESFWNGAVVSLHRLVILKPLWKYS